MSRSDVYEVVIKPMRAVFSPPTGVAKDDEARALEEYADALRAYDERDLRDAWTQVRNANKRGFWPPIGMLVDACNVAKRARRDRSPRAEIVDGRVVNGEYQPWGGACKCQRCAQKIASHGFWRASSAEREAQSALDSEVVDWTAYQIERLPPVKSGETVAQYRARISELRQA